MKTKKRPVNGTGNEPSAGSLTKALAIIEAAVQQPQPPTTAELGALLGLAKPTAHRLTSTLRELGFLQREPAGGRIIAGDRLIALSLNVITSAARLGPSHNILDALAEETGETCNLGIMAAGQVVYVDRCETKWPLGLRFEAGSRVPIHCTALGKMFLSNMSAGQRRKYLATLPLTRYTEYTYTDPVKLEEELVKIRDEGVSFDNCEFMSGVVCMAVPIQGPKGNIVAGVAVSAPEARLTLEDLREYLPALKVAASKFNLIFADDSPAT
ncbi:MAG: IclR family transcriptional regulator [Gammaproteobacteria bacterium]|nr:MAG: IclR family transcriptional regulator [Gammaproteobacteria bacterium]